MWLFSLFAGESIGMTQVYDPNKCSPNKKLACKDLACDPLLTSGGFLKWWYQTTIGFPTEHDHFGVFWGYHHFWKHPSTNKIMIFGGDLLQAWAAWSSDSQTSLPKVVRPSSRKPSENMSPPKAWLWNHHFKKAPFRVMQKKTTKHGKSKPWTKMYIFPHRKKGHVGSIILMSDQALPYQRAYSSRNKGFRRSSETLISKKALHNCSFWEILGTHKSCHDIARYFGKPFWSPRDSQEKAMSPKKKLVWLRGKRSDTADLRNFAVGLAVFQFWHAKNLVTSTLKGTDTYPTWGKGKIIDSKVIFDGIC